MLNVNGALGGSSSFFSALPLPSLGVFKCVIVMTAQSWFVAWHNTLGKGSDLSTMCTEEILRLSSKQEIRVI